MNTVIRILNNIRLAFFPIAYGLSGALIGGTLNAMNAYTTGKLKIEGDLMKSQLIEKLFKIGK